MSENHPIFGSSNSDKCRETSGFLFSHQCENIAKYNCLRCGKPVCAQHIDYKNIDEPTCISCSKIQDQPAAQPQSRPYSSTDSTLDPYPYWYIDHHYDNYSWRDDNFTEADESVLIGDDHDDIEWENNMGAS